LGPNRYSRENPVVDLPEVDDVLGIAAINKILIIKCCITHVLQILRGHSPSKFVPGIYESIFRPMVQNEYYHY